MDAVLYVGELNLVSPEIIMKLERYGLELVQFKTVDELIPYLNDINTKMVMVRVNLEDDHKALREQVKLLNNRCRGCVPIVLVTIQDSLKLRQIYLDLSYVHFLQFNEERSILRKNFESMLTEIDNREQMRQLKFAVIDDDKLQLLALQKLFQKHGIINVSFYSHPDEFDAENDKFDLYLVDLVMPGKTGEEVIFEIRKKCTEAVILAVSSLENTEIIAQVLSLGADDFIVKPYNETIFMAKILSYSRLRFLLKENKRKTEELREISLRDPMTNLYNHRQIELTLSELSEVYMTEGTVHSVLMLDIDYFKKINDTHGHKVGDEILISISNMLRDMIDGRGIIGRYGGEEFIVILPGVVEAEAFFLSEKIRRSIENMVFVDRIKVTVSIGIAEAGQHDRGIVERADQMLYHAKKAGRNRVSCYSRTS
ncbi:diguanylate cyclase [Fusibacter sp. JL216-2]|uniref:diguanylate cyclase n=1 Tax=Fusibacter sp. JL216-2 TaxID=3071453 RepID=UPI003D34CB02